LPLDVEVECRQRAVALAVQPGLDALGLVILDVWRSRGTPAIMRTSSMVVLFLTASEALLGDVTPVVEPTSFCSIASRREPDLV
jgi:hypothetical protein